MACILVRTPQSIHPIFEPSKFLCFGFQLEVCLFFAFYLQLLNLFTFLLFVYREAGVHNRRSFGRKDYPTLDYCAIGKKNTLKRQDQFTLNFQFHEKNLLSLLFFFGETKKIINYFFREMPTFKRFRYVVPVQAAQYIGRKF